MLIGIDARTLSSPLTGIGCYTNELAKSLLGIKGNHLSLYAPSPLGADEYKGLKKSEIKCGSSSNRLARMVWSQTQLPRWANNDQIDIFWGPTHRLPRFLNKSIPRVVTIHDLVWREAPETMRSLSCFVEKRLMPEAIDLADLVMADSQSTADGIACFFPQYAHKVRVVHLGVANPLDAGPMASIAALGIAKPYFLFVGTIEPRKNLERLLQAFARLPPVYQEQFSLVIAGAAGWGGVDLERLIYQHRLENSVCVLGYVTNQQLASLYAHARFLAMPSLYEGFGLPLVEAMQYGTPLLTSNTSSMPEVAGDAGVLVNPLSIESISSALERMLSDDGLIELLRFNALERAQQFSWKKCAEQAMDVFREAIELHGTRN